jgi:prepilin-type N-terminal cleavage/methylation domain-containing protein
MDRGFTLVEVLVAVSVAVIAIAGIAQLPLIAAAATRSARMQSTATALAAQKLEQLRALTWTFDAADQPVSDTTTDLSANPPAAWGSGLGPSPPGTLDRDVAGYVDYLDATGRWAGAGSSAPPRATYARRWSVAPLPGDASAGTNDSLVLQVLVTKAARPPAGVSGRPRRPEDVVLTTVLTRKAP